MKHNDYKEQNVIVNGKETSLLELKKLFGEYEHLGKKYILLSPPVPANKYELEFAGTLQARAVPLDWGDNNRYYLYLKDNKVIKVRNIDEKY